MGRVLHQATAGSSTVTAVSPSQAESSLTNSPTASGTPNAGTAAALAAGRAAAAATAAATATSPSLPHRTLLLLNSATSSTHQVVLLP